MRYNVCEQKKKKENTVVKKSNVDEFYLKFKCQ